MTTAGDGLTPSGGINETIGGNAVATVYEDRRSAIGAHNPFPHAYAVGGGKCPPPKNSSCPVHAK